MTLVLAFTPDLNYQPLIDSCRHFRGRKCALILGNPVEIPGFEVASVPVRNLKSFRQDWPRNRKFFACAEGGEFLDYFDFDSDEVIIHLDVDFLIQKKPKKLNPKGIMSNWGAYPPVTLEQEFFSLLPKSYSQGRAAFPKSWNHPMFCAGFVCMRAQTYSEVSKLYLDMHKSMTQVFDHHAGGQWLLNYIVHNYFTYQNLPDDYHNAIWYKGSGCKIIGGELYHKGKLVTFNHTKFDRRFYEKPED